jgi:hypothetical protein
MIKVNKSVLRPEIGPEFFPSHQFAGISEQNEQDLEGLLAHLQFRSVFTQLAGAQIQGIGAKQRSARRCCIHVRAKTGPARG